MKDVTLHIDGLDPKNPNHIDSLVRATRRAVMYETTVTDSGEPEPHDALLHWQLRAAAAEQRASAAMAMWKAADRAATFYAGCAFLFLVSWFLWFLIMTMVKG